MAAVPVDNLLAEPFSNSGIYHSSVSPPIGRRAAFGNHRKADRARRLARRASGVVGRMYAFVAKLLEADANRHCYLALAEHRIGSDDSAELF